MKRSLVRLLLLSSAITMAATVHAQGRWENLNVGMSVDDVVTTVGAPLIAHGGRGYQQWTFDQGGSVMFRQGTVLHWNTPRGYQPAPKSPLLAVISAPIPGHEITPTTSAIGTPEATSNPSLTVPEIITPNGPQYQRNRVNTETRRFDEIIKS